MSIVLSILQIIGWILLAILILLIAAVLIFLFCPVRYLIEGEFLEEKWAKFHIHWLWRLIRAKVAYEDDLIYGEVHALWIKKTFSYHLSKNEDEEESEEDMPKEIVPDEVVVVEMPSNDEESASESGEPSDEEQSAILKGKETVSSNETEDATQESKEIVSSNETEDVTLESKEIVSSNETEDATQENEEIVSSNETEDTTSEDEETANLSEEQEVTSDKSMFSKIKGMIERIKSIYLKIKTILTDEQNKSAVKHLKKEVLYLIKILLPKKSNIQAVFSTGAPDTTGQLFGILACFPAMYRKDWELLPDFQAEEPYFKGSFQAKGSISLYQFVGIALRILFDKKCRRLYTVIRKFLKQLKE